MVLLGKIVVSRFFPCSLLFNEERLLAGKPEDKPGRNPPEEVYKESKERLVECLLQ